MRTRNALIAESGRSSSNKAGRSKSARLGMLAALAAAALFPSVGDGLQEPFPHYPPEITRMPDRNTVDDINQYQKSRDAFDAINAERKKEMGDDSTRLLILASDLRTQVGRPGEDAHSRLAIKETEEIEKLAHDVVEKMKLTVGPS